MMPEIRLQDKVKVTAVTRVMPCHEHCGDINPAKALTLLKRVGA